MNEEKVKALLITIGALVWEKGVLMSKGGEFHCEKCRKVHDLLERESPYPYSEHLKAATVRHEEERMRRESGIANVSVHAEARLPRR